MSNIVNDQNSDYHIHSTFSDGLPTIEEIVQYAWVLGMEEIAITDHSDHATKILEELCWIRPSGARYTLGNWINVHNNVKVIFWVEGDVLNEKGDVCLTNQGIEWSFVVLSVHFNGYLSEHKTATKWLLNAIERYHDKINVIGHPYNDRELWEFLEIEPIVELANKYWIAVEFNYWTFKHHLIKEKLDYVLKNAKNIYVNSDAHTLWSIKPKRQDCYNYLQELWLWK